MGALLCVAMRPGGRFCVAFCNSDGAKHTCSGVYDEVHEYGTLSFSPCINGNGASVIGKLYDIENQVNKKL